MYASAAIRVVGRRANQSARAELAGLKHPKKSSDGRSNPIHHPAGLPRRYQYLPRKQRAILILNSQLAALLTTLGAGKHSALHGLPVLGHPDEVAASGQMSPCCGGCS
jgi:hypothetical protein